MNDRKILLNESQIQKLETFLYEMPMKYAQPIMNMLVEGIQSEPVKVEQKMTEQQTEKFFIEAKKI
jgi:hypothetical protein